MTLSEIIRSGKLTFAGSHKTGEPIRFSTLSRVREPVSRSKAGVQGKVADVLRGRSRHAESQNEIRGFRLLIATSRADDWQEQPFSLEYHSEGHKHRYTPDVLVAWDSHQEVVEIKGDREAELPENQEHFRLISELLAEYGYHFRLWKASEIGAEPRLTNASLVLRYRCAPVLPAERVRLYRAISRSPELRLRELCKVSNAAVESALRLVLDGTLHIDWWERLDLESRVSIIPIGRQIWPSPPTLPQLSPEEAKCHRR